MKPEPDARQPVVAWMILATLVLLAAGCGPAPSARLDPARNRLPLEAWVTVLPDADGELRPCVQVSAPLRSLVFYRADERFHSGLEVRVTAWRDEVQAGGGVGEARVTVADHDATRAETALDVTVPLLLRGDGPVSLEVMARVTDSSRGWSRELTFTPGALARLPLWIASVQAVPATGIGADLTLDAATDSLRLRVTLQRRVDSPDLPTSGLSLVSEATGAVLGEMTLMRQPVPADLAAGEARAVDMIWPTASLPFGRCHVHSLVELARDTEWVRLPHEPPLEVVNLRVPLADDDTWRRQLKWLDERLLESRRDSLSDRPADERPAAWAAIWREVGVAVGQPADAVERRHLLRIVAADDRFGTYGRGALSDRGRTLIRWGEPTRIETYGDARAAGAVWEVWDYAARGRRIFFFDAHGVGDFRRRGDEFLDP